MEIILNCGDKINIPDGCKAKIKEGVITIESAVKEFKDGDILTSNIKECVMIYRKRDRRRHPEAAYYHCYATRECLRVVDDAIESFFDNINFWHLATEEETQFLFDKMAEQNLRWNAEEKKVEKIRWRAEKEGFYYFFTTSLNVAKAEEDGKEVASHRYAAYNYFRTEEQAEKASELIKATLKKFHEENQIKD